MHCNDDTKLYYDLTAAEVREPCDIINMDISSPDDISKFHGLNVNTSNSYVEVFGIDYCSGILVKML